MELKYKPDFERVMQRFEAWWHCQIVDRPLVNVAVRRERPPVLPEKTHATERERWMDADYALDRHAAGLEGAVFLGETVPLYFPNLGPEICATVFGGELEFGATTSWSIPCAKSCREILALRPNLDNPYWSRIRRMTDLSLERGRGEWITAVTDLHTNADLVASLRDPQHLAMEMAEDVETVAQAVEHVTDSFSLIYNDLWGRIRAQGQPSTTWLPSLHAGPSYTVSCDFICMISPAMFERAVLPSLGREMRSLDRSIFHLDGPGALRHLDALLACRELNALQWVYGAGRGPARNWISVYQKAQAAGKALYIVCEDLEDAYAVAKEIRPEGAWFVVSGRAARDEAEAFIRWVERWGAGKH